MHRSCTSLLLIVIVAASAGCGGSKVKRFAVSGNATFAGRPIPVGKIYFTPDGGKGNTGAAGHATIKDGKYDTADGGQGTIGGPMIVRIEGADGVALDEERPNGKPLFAYYETRQDLPQETSSQDFDVPATATAAVPPGALPMIVP